MLMPGFEYYEVKKKLIILKQENGNTFTILIIFIVKSLQKEQNSTNYYYDPQSTGINLQSPQSDSTPWTLTLTFPSSDFYFFKSSNFISLLTNIMCCQVYD